MKKSKWKKGKKAKTIKITSPKSLRSKVTPIRIRRRRNIKIASTPRLAYPKIKKIVAGNIRVV